MINIDFYKEAINILIETENERSQHFKKLNEQICTIYNINGKGKFNIKPIKDEHGNQTDIGAFDIFSKTMFLEETYIKELKLSQEQLFEIVESLLHEPKHLKQLLEYEKDNNKYPGIYTSMPSGLGYHSQK